MSFDVSLNNDTGLDTRDDWAITGTPYVFSGQKEKVCWNGRDIQEQRSSFISQPSQEILHKLHRHKDSIKPMMSRPPDRSEASIEAGYADTRGVFVEGKWTLTWENNKETNSESDKGREVYDPPDSRDRDFEKDTDRG